METMRTREIIVALAGVLTAIGGAALIEAAQQLWPDRPGVIFLAGCVLVTVGLAAFGWSMISARKEVQMSDDKEDDQTRVPYTGPTTGLRIKNSSDNKFLGTPRIHGFDNAIEMEDSHRNEWHGGIEASAPNRSKPKDREHKEGP